MRKSSNSSSTAATTNNVDRRTVNDGGISVSGDGNAVTANLSYTDAGSVAAAFDFAKGSTETTYKSTADAVGLARDGLKLNLEQSKINADGLLSGMGKLIDFAKATTDTAKAVNETATKNVAQAYQNVQEIGTGQKFLVAGGLVLAGIVAVSKIKG
ncbi:hypothetical protein E5S69_29675 [Cupriavidus necator]|uniref:hypothetical protein n=1 Tax=Cupriavidus necator TaxID=106590 RepID=UPI00148FE874|nr:hypothetical protein [Cupriavidus necator]NOV27657.1 hypothetical protein [Cupriavidus necator]